jgi:hypothetical protein
VYDDLLPESSDVASEYGTEEEITASPFSEDRGEPLSWVDLWAIGRYDLGLTIEEFGCLTGDSFEAMLERKMEDRRQTVGLLAATIVNAAPFGSRDREPVTASDFFPDYRKKEIPAREGYRQTAEDHERILTAIFKRPPEKRPSQSECPKLPWET